MTDRARVLIGDLLDRARDDEDVDLVVYAVVFSDYDPAEVVALYTNHAAAEADRNARNARDPDVVKSGVENATGPWQVIEWSVRERYESEPP